jgi:O-antigen ligase
MARELPEQPNSHTNIGFFFLLLYTVALFIRPQEWSYTPDPFPVARIFLILAFICHLTMQRPKIFGYHGMFLVGIFLLIPLSGIRNHDLGEAIYQAQNFFIYSILPIILFASLAQPQRKQYWVFVVMAIACAVMLHHGISQKLSPDGIGWSGELLSQGTRITFLGFFNDPNDLGMFFLMNIPILFYLRSVTKNGLLRLTYLALIVGLVAGIFLTNSRGSLVGFLALLLAYFYFRYGKMKTIFFTILFLPITFFIMSKFRTIDSEEGSADGRIQAWYEGIQMFKYRPLFGIGKGQFVEAHGLTAHNSYVLVLSELGLIGYTLWFTTICLTLFMLIKIFTLSKEKYQNKPDILNDIFLAKCLFFSFLGFLTTAFFLSRSYVVFLYVFLGISLAVYVRVKKHVPEIAEIEIKQILPRIVGLGLLSLIGLYVIIVILV